MTSVNEKSLEIIIEKSERALHLCEIADDRGRIVCRSYRIALGNSPAGAKKSEGDGATPEGEYYITHRNSLSRYHLSLGISYPNDCDASQGLASGLITESEYEAIRDAISRNERPPQKTALGGDIFIHGGGTTSDWTAGCIALENDDIEALFDVIPLRTRIIILP